MLDDSFLNDDNKVPEYAPCSLLKVYRRFRGVYCFHHHGDDYMAQFKKNCAFMLMAVRNLNLI
jgi:hypothetical protein